MNRAAGRRVVLGAVALVLALAGYAVGHSGDPSEDELTRARAESMRVAERTAEKRAYAAGRRRGRSEGLRRGREAGAKKGRRDGRERTQQAVAPPQTGTTDQQTGGQPDYSEAPLNGSTETPSADSPEGQRLLRESPDCRDKPPPPPGYDGPVQC